MQCSNNLKQIGVAMHNFAAAHGSFPMGIVSRTKLEWPYFLHLLYPYLELDGYFAAIHGPTFDAGAPWLPSSTPAPEWLAMDGVAISGFLCPSDYLGASCLLANGFRVAKSNYLGFFSGLHDQAGLYPAPDGNGNPPSLSPQELRDLPHQRAVFRCEEVTSFNDITDGTSNVMAVAEYLKGVDESDVRGAFYSNRSGLQMLFVRTGPNSVGEDSLYSGFCTADYNQPSLNLPCNGGGGTHGYATSRSRHPGGVNVLYCDGSVHFVPDTVDFGIWQALGWINDGKPISVDF